MVFVPRTSLLGDLLQVFSQLAQVLVQVLAAAHLEELLLVAAQLLLLLTQLGRDVVLVLLARRQLFAEEKRDSVGNI